MALMQQCTILHISFESPQEVWDAIGLAYTQMEGWLGYGKGGEYGREAVPYWFSHNEKEKHIIAGIQYIGVVFQGLMEDDEWNVWIDKFVSMISPVVGEEIPILSAQ